MLCVLGTSHVLTCFGLAIYHSIINGIICQGPRTAQLSRGQGRTRHARAQRVDTGFTADRDTRVTPHRLFFALLVGTIRYS